MTSNWIKLTVAATMLAAAPVVAALAAAPHSAADNGSRSGAQSSSGKAFPRPSSTVPRAATTTPRPAAATSIVGNYSPFGAERAAADDAAWQAIVTGGPASEPAPGEVPLLGRTDIAGILGGAYNGR